VPLADVRGAAAEPDLETLALALAGCGAGGHRAHWAVGICSTDGGEDVGVTKTIVDSDREFAETMETFDAGRGEWCSSCRSWITLKAQSPVFPRMTTCAVSLHEDLRYSFGSDKGRVETAWQRVIVGMPPGGADRGAGELRLLRHLRESRGIPRTKARPLLEKYKAAGRTEVDRKPADGICAAWVLKALAEPGACRRRGRCLPPAGTRSRTAPPGTSGDRLANSSHATLVLHQPGIARRWTNDATSISPPLERER